MPTEGAARHDEARPPATGRWALVRSGGVLALGVLSLYVLLPSLLSVFGSWRSLSHLDWFFAVLVLVSVVASFLCLWELERIALRTRAWFPVLTAELSSNALSHVIPTAAAGGALETTMLTGPAWMRATSWPR